MLSLLGLSITEIPAREHEEKLQYFGQVKRREVKSKGEKERSKHLNAEFQRVARRHKKAFLSDQCKEIQENNRMGKTRDLFKKIRDTKGTFHAKMGSIKDRNSMDLTETEDIKKRWQEYTEELYKKEYHVRYILGGICCRYRSHASHIAGKLIYQDIVRKK